MVWLEQHSLGCIRPFLLQQLTEQPFNTKKKRLRLLEDGALEIAYRTWRIRFTACPEERQIELQAIYSGYTAKEIRDTTDLYKDKKLHCNFQAVFSPKQSQSGI